MTFHTGVLSITPLSLILFFLAMHRLGWRQPRWSLWLQVLWLVGVGLAFASLVVVDFAP